jgi:hypothetical protein
MFQSRRVEDLSYVEFARVMMHLYLEGTENRMRGVIGAKHTPAEDVIIALSGALIELHMEMAERFCAIINETDPALWSEMLERDPALKERIKAYGRSDEKLKALMRELMAFVRKSNELREKGRQAVGILPFRHPAPR